MNAPDRIHLQHMLDAAQEAIGFAEGRTRADLEQDRMLLRALVKDIEIVGEAASRLSRALQDRYAHVPWADIVGMRNRLIHAYFDVDLDRVWDTVQQDLPYILAEVRRILETDP